MNTTVRKGQSLADRVTVDLRRGSAVFGDDLLVYATAALLQDIEATCRKLLRQCGAHDSVTAQIELEHVAATPVGMTVEITATVAEVEGPRIVFDIDARDAVERIAHGRHVRYLVDVARSILHIRQKASRLRS